MATTQSTKFIDEADFAAMNDQVKHEDELREDIIKRSREVLKGSKTAIYCLHRKDFAKADAQLNQAEKVANQLLPITETYPHLRYGSLTNSLEEWAEGKIYQHFLLHGTIPLKSDLSIVNVEEYLGGIMDFTGELNRHAVLRATARDIDEVTKCREVVDQLMAQLMQFDFRNGSLRKKYDSMKYTLKKLETIIYELSLTSASGGVRPTSTQDDNAGPTEDDDNNQDRKRPRKD